MFSEKKRTRQSKPKRCCVLHGVLSVQMSECSNANVIESNASTAALWSHFRLIADNGGREIAVHERVTNETYERTIGWRTDNNARARTCQQRLSRTRRVGRIVFAGTQMRCALPSAHTTVTRFPSGITDTPHKRDQRRAWQVAECSVEGGKACATSWCELARG